MKTAAKVGMKVRTKWGVGEIVAVHRDPDFVLGSRVIYDLPTFVVAYENGERRIVVPADAEEVTDDA